MVLAELLALGVKLEDAALLPARGVVEREADGLLELVKDRGHARDLLVPAIVDELRQAAAAGRLAVLKEAGERAGQAGPQLGEVLGDLVGRELSGRDGEQRAQVFLGGADQLAALDGAAREDDLLVQPGALRAGHDHADVAERRPGRAACRWGRCGR